MELIDYGVLAFLAVITIVLYFKIDMEGARVKALVERLHADLHRANPRSNPTQYAAGVFDRVEVHPDGAQKQYLTHVLYEIKADGTSSAKEVWYTDTNLTIISTPVRPEDLEKFAKQVPPTEERVTPNNPGDFQEAMAPNGVAEGDNKKDEAPF